MKKYELVADDFISVDGSRRYRIRALVPIHRHLGSRAVKSGELGGYIEHEGNLSHRGRCWVYDFGSVGAQACVLQSGTVEEFARVSGSAKIYGTVGGLATVTDQAVIKRAARVEGEASVRESASVKSGLVTGNAVISGSAVTHGIIGGSATVTDQAQVEIAAAVIGSSRIMGSAVVEPTARVFGNSLIQGRVYSGEHCVDVWRLPEIAGK